MLRRPRLRISPQRARWAFAPWVVAGALSACGGEDPKALAQPTAEPAPPAANRAPEASNPEMSEALSEPVEPGATDDGGEAPASPPDDTLRPELRAGLLRRLEQTTEPDSPQSDTPSSTPVLPPASMRGDGPGPAQPAQLTDGAEVATSPFCADVAQWDSQWAALEDEILERVNQVRAAGAECDGVPQPPVSPVSTNPLLRCAARVHSLDMAERDFFDHVNPDGDGPGERVDAAGFVGRTWGENIAGGSATAEGTMQQWLDSPGHCLNIMRPGFTLLGVGYFPGGAYRHSWTQVFGG